MSRLLALNELAVNGIDNPSSKGVLLAASRLRGINDVDPSGSEINYFESFGSQNPKFSVGEAKSTVLSRANAANTTNNVVELSLTEKFSDGTTQAITVNIEEILRVYPYPGDSADSFLVLEDETRTSIITKRVDETWAAIQSAANA